MSRTAVFAILGCLALTGCGGGNGGGGASLAAGTYTAASGVAEKGPLIKGSTVTAQELDASLSPTGKQYSYQVTSDLGTFSPTSTFGSQYIGVLATGYYFDEVANGVSSGTVTLNSYSDLSSGSVLNVNLLTTLEYQRIQNLVTKSSMTFAAARTQAENEVLAALNIPAGSYGNFDSLDLSGGTDGDHILVAISSIFTYGNAAGPLNQLIADFQSDIATNGVITDPKTTAALVAAAKAINPSAIAAHLTTQYASAGLVFAASDISDWIAQAGDGVIGKFAFQVADATPSSLFTLPSSVVSQFAGTSLSVTAGRLAVNGIAATGTITFKTGDVVTLAPSAGVFPNGVLNSYLVSGRTNVVRVSFVSGLVSIAVTPDSPGVPLGLTQQFKATGTFSDTSTADLTAKVAWTSAAPAVATIDAASAVATPLTVGTTLISATSGSVSGNTTLTVTPALLKSIAVLPNPATAGVGLHTQLSASGTYSDGSTQNVTLSANWTSDTPAVGTVGPTTGLVTGVLAGSATISATIGSVTGTVPLAVVVNNWVATGSMTTVRTGHTATLLGSGAVLVAGGLCCSGTDAYAVSTEIYEPTTGTWSVTGSLNVGVSGHTATLLANGKVLFAGGLGVAGYSAGAEIYDPATGVWTGTANMTTARSEHTATLLPNGTVLIAGGNSALAVSESSAEIYDPVAATWTPTGSLNTARRSQTATLLPDGTVLVAGGGTDCVAICSAVAGATTEIYDPAAGTWSVTASMSTARFGHTSTLLTNGTVLVAGGDSRGVLSTAEVYDPAAVTWTLTGSLHTPRLDHSAALLLDGTVLVAGGNNDTGTLASAEIYDPVAATWALTGSLNTARVSATATVLANGTVLAAGGADDNGDIFRSAEIFYP